QSVGQTNDESAAAATHDHHIQELLLLRQIALDLHGERRIGEEIGQKEAEQAVPVTQSIAINGHGTLSLHQRQSHYSECRRKGRWERGRRKLRPELPPRTAHETLYALNPLRIAETLLSFVIKRWPTRKGKFPHISLSGTA